MVYLTAMAVRRCILIIASQSAMNESRSFACGKDDLSLFLGQEREMSLGLVSIARRMRIVH